MNLTNQLSNKAQQGAQADGKTAAWLKRLGSKGRTMPVDELSEGLFRGLFRLIGQFIIEVISEIILHKTGWLFLRIVTLGNYPPPDPQKYNEGFVIAAGIAVWAGIAALAWALFK